MDKEGGHSAPYEDQPNKDRNDDTQAKTDINTTSNQSDEQTIPTSQQPVDKGTASQPLIYALATDNKLVSESTTGQTKDEEPPANQTATGEASPDNVVADEKGPNNKTVASEAPTEQVSSGQAPGTEKTNSQAPSNETSGNQISAGEAPNSQVPATSASTATPTVQNAMIDTTSKPVKTIYQTIAKQKEVYPENVLATAKGGFNDFLPAWAFPKVQIKAVVSYKEKSGEKREEEKVTQVIISDTIDALDKHMVKAVLSQFEYLTISKVYHYAQLGEFTAIMFREKKLVDVLVHILDKTYYAHKHVLCCHSEFFSILLMAHSKPPDVITDVTLSDIPPLHFQNFLHFCYYGEIELNETNIPPLLNLCNKLNATMLRSKIHLFIAAHGDLHIDLVKKILNSQLKADRPLAIMAAIEKFDELCEDIQFLARLAFEDLVEILSSDDLNVKSELTVFWAAILWIADDVRDRFQYFDMVINTVRMTCMSTLELMDISRASTLIRLSKTTQQIIMNATWVCHAREMGLTDPLSLPIQTPRKRLIDKPPYHPSRAEFDKRYRQYKTLIGDDNTGDFFKTLESLSPGKQTGRVVFADEKGSDLEYVYVAEHRIEHRVDDRPNAEKRRRTKAGTQDSDRTGPSRKKKGKGKGKASKLEPIEEASPDSYESEKKEALDLWQGSKQRTQGPDGPRPRKKKGKGKASELEPIEEASPDRSEPEKKEALDLWQRTQGPDGPRPTRKKKGKGKTSELEPIEEASPDRSEPEKKEALDLWQGQPESDPQPDKPVMKPRSPPTYRKSVSSAKMLAGKNEGTLT